MIFRYLIVFVFFSIFNSFSLAQDNPFKIEGIPQKDELKPFWGNDWYIYIDGEIPPNAASLMEDYIVKNNVPMDSTVYLNSLGGNLLGGIELGKVFRKYEFRTTIGTKHIENGNRSSKPGVCYSSCALAFLGGKFRYKPPLSVYGVHRFYANSGTNLSGDTAQIISASIVNYLKDMSIDTYFFTSIVAASPTEIYIPNNEILEKYNVINNGILKPNWTIESSQSYLYLKGERETTYGINKFITFCDNNQAILYIVFDPKGRQEEVMNLNAHSLYIDGNYYPIKSTFKEILNGWYNSYYVLTAEQIRAISNSKEVGVVLQFMYSSPVFLGFQNMPFTGARDKLLGVLKNCIN